MPRSRSLSVVDVAEAALAVAGREGLTMRAVAAELGLSTMALYRYVADRTALEALVVDHVWRTVDTVPPPGDLPWRARVTEMAGRVRQAFAEHPAVVPLTLLHRHRTLGALRWSEAVLSILAEAGFTGRERVLLIRALYSYIAGAIQLEHLGSLSGDAGATLAALPVEDFPHTVDNVRHARGVTVEDQFAAGLAMLLG